MRDTNDFEIIDLRPGNGIATILYANGLIGHYNACSFSHPTDPDFIGAIELTDGSGRAIHVSQAGKDKLLTEANDYCIKHYGTSIRALCGAERDERIRERLPIRPREEYDEMER